MHYFPTYILLRPTFNVRIQVILDFSEDEEDLVLGGFGVVRDLARQVRGARDGALQPRQEEDHAPVRRRGVEEAHMLWTGMNRTCL